MIGVYMSRSARQSKILDLIVQRNIETQEELVAALRDDGFDVTQATVSRDVKELGLVKTQDSYGRYCYAAQPKAEKLSGKLLTVLREAIISVVTAENLAVVRTIANGASAVASAVEQLSLGVLGILAYNDTVLIVTATAKDAAVVAQKINQLI